MVTRNVLISKVNDVKELSAEANKVAFTIDICASHYVIDAKSLMSIFALDLSKPVRVCVHADEDEAADFLKAIKKFVVEE